MTSSAQTVRETTEIGIHPKGYRLPATPRLGSVRLAVSQLAPSVDFYTRVIGFEIREDAGNIVRLGVRGTSEVLLELEALPGVKAIGRRTRLGLYHTAFLLPSREALSSFVQHLTKLNIPFGAGDHLYSEALYLTDPDGLSIEVYADRPRSEWQIENHEIVSATETVRFHELPPVPDDSWRGAPAGTTMGHVHFYVGDLEQAAKFYHVGLGFDITTWRYPGALFASAGGYHHHVGLNEWAAGSPVAARTDARLLFWELLLPSEEDVKAVAASLAKAGYIVTAIDASTRSASDPWGITLRLAVASHR